MISIPLRDRDGATVAYTIVDDERADLLRFRWCLAKGGYARRGARGPGRKYIHVVLHRMVLPPPHGLEIDHINGDRLDNRRSNLRAVTRSQNLTNRTRPQRTNTSGVRGVSFDKARGKWAAAYKLNRKYVHVGRFETLAAAARAVSEARRAAGFLEARP